MERRRRPRTFSFLEEAGFRLREYGTAWLVVALLCALFVGLLLLLQRGEPAPYGPQSQDRARILRFGYYDGKWVRQPVVIVRTGDGRVLQFAARRQALRHCRRGDMIAIVRQGSALFVHPDGCSAAARP